MECFKNDFPKNIRFIYLVIFVPVKFQGGSRFDRCDFGNLQQTELETEKKTMVSDDIDRSKFSLKIFAVIHSLNNKIPSC
jgi:hypothetical protein